jgi:vacuolar-type H+-ATPase subunit I/STV1
MERFMSKALELLANIDKKYNSELQRTEEQLLSGIEQTSQIIKDNLSTRANITATAIQQSDEKLAQNLQNSSQQIEKQLDQYQALLQSKLSRLKQMNEQIQTEEQQVQNKSLLKQLTTLNMAMILGAAILIILIIALGFMGKSKYNEIRTLNMTINEKQMRVDHLNRSGGSLTFSTCRQQNSKAQRLCIQINKNAGEWQNGYMIPMGY